MTLFSRALISIAAVLATAAAPERPNIVLILADDQGYGDLGCYGATDFATPNLDRMAREGTRLTWFSVAQPVCTASRAALLSGCYSNRVSMAGALNHTSNVGINPSETLLPELCRAQGYATAIYGKWHLGHRPPFLPTRNGFDEFFGLPYSNDNGPLHPVTKGIPPLPLYENESIIERDPDQSQFTRRLTDRAVGFIARNKDRPFFLYVPQIMPHVPIFASSAFRGRSRHGLYGDVIEELDASVGRILAALRDNGLDERTIVIYASDNGPFLSYGEHAGSAGRLREGKLTTFEGGVRVPCLIRWPGHVPADRVLDEPVASMDLCATLAHLAGAALPSGVKTDGLDLTPLLLGTRGATGRDVFWYYSGDELHAVRQGRWKLHLPHEYLTVAGPPGRGGKPSNYGKLEPKPIELSGIRGIASRHGYRFEGIGVALYDLKADPGEATNVADTHPDVVRRLQAIAADARADLGDSLTGARGANVRACGEVGSGGSATVAASDPARARTDAAGSLVWHDVRDFEVEGKGWTDTKAFFDRLPARAEGVVRPPVWSLSRQTAGLCVRFATDATAIQARWTLTSKNLGMPHMPPTGVSGLDLYVEAPDGRWRWLANGRPAAEGTSQTSRLVSGLPDGRRTYLLYLPLYNGVSSVEIGVDRAATIARAAPRTAAHRRPIVFYGTSITQGGCASRPGMVHTAIVGRRFNRPVINLGFSGNGKMEPELAALLAELDPVVYVLDCLPNMNDTEVSERVEPFVRTLRKARPKTPIVLAEDRTLPVAFLLPSARARSNANHRALRTAYERLIDAGVEGLRYLPGDVQIGDDGEGTVDGSHPTDLGFLRMADAFGAVLEPLLRGEGDSPAR